MLRLGPAGANHADPLAKVGFEGGTNKVLSLKSLIANGYAHLWSRILPGCPNKPASGVRSRTFDVLHMPFLFFFPV